MNPISGSAMHKTLWLIFLVAVALRIAAVLVLREYVRPVMMENSAIAEMLLEGHGYSVPVLHRTGRGSAADVAAAASPALVAAHPLPTSNQPPGYPYVLYLLWKVFGRQPATFLGLSLAQALLVASAIFPTAWLTSRWLGERAGIAAAWLTCAMPPHIWFATRIHHGAVAIAAYPWLAWGWIRVHESPSWKGRALLGIAVGVAGLFQPLVLGVFGILGVFGLARSIMERNGGQVLRWAFLGTVVAVTLAPWTWRNYRVHGCFVPVKNSFPKELWIGNNPHATGASVLADGRESVFQAVLPKYVQVTPAMTERELMERLGSLARQHIREAPWSFARRTAAKVVWFWTTVPHRLTGTDSARNRFWVFQLCYWSVLVALWACGCVMRRGGSREYVTLLSVCGALYSIAYGLTFVDHSRFRAEIEFLFIPPAACCLSRIAERAGLWRKGAVARNGVSA